MLAALILAAGINKNSLRIYPVESATVPHGSKTNQSKGANRAAALTHPPMISIAETYALEEALLSLSGLRHCGFPTTVWFLDRIATRHFGFWR